jgi:hypothetical protein
MVRLSSFGILAFVLMFGTSTYAVAADQSSGGMGQDKGAKSSTNKEKSKQGKPKSNQDSTSSSVGPHGEAEQGGAGPSGPAPLPPGKAPGFEGAGKEKGRGPTEGGPR